MRLYIYLVDVQAYTVIKSWCNEINNGNWTEWSAIWAEIIRVISKSIECAARVRFEITIWFPTKVAWHEVQLPLYYIHFEIAQIQDLVTSNISLMQYWADLKLNFFFFWGVGGGGSKSFGNKSINPCPSFSCNFIGYFQALKSDWLFCF